MKDSWVSSLARFDRLVRNGRDNYFAIQLGVRRFRKMLDQALTQNLEPRQLLPKCRVLWPLFAMKMLK
jgi:hypothetical protein